MFAECVCTYSSSEENVIDKNHWIQCLLAFNDSLFIHTLQYQSIRYSSNNSTENLMRAHSSCTHDFVWIACKTCHSTTKQLAFWSFFTTDWRIVLAIFEIEIWKSAERLMLVWCFFYYVQWCFKMNLMWFTNSSNEDQLIFSVDLYVWYLSLCWIIMCIFDSVIYVSSFTFLNTFVFRLRNFSWSCRSFITLVIFKWCFEKLSKSLILSFCSVRIACQRQSLMK